MNASLTDFKLPSQGQHERVFLDDASKRYKARLITAAGYIYSICRIYRAEGHKLNISKPKQFYEHFGIPKSTFYRALIQLEKTENIKFCWQPIGGISMWWGEPAAASVQPAAASVEPQQFNQIPLHIRGDFEAFVRSQWWKIKNQEIRSFHRFVEKVADFKAWWEKFNLQQPIPSAVSAVTHVEPVLITPSEPLTTQSERMSSDKLHQLRQLIQSKK